LLGIAKSCNSVPQKISAGYGPVNKYPERWRSRTTQQIILRGKRFHACCASWKVVRIANESLQVKWWTD